jgi:hypothetical protein
MQVYDAVNRHFNFDELKVLIIASPGFEENAPLPLRARRNRPSL